MLRLLMAIAVLFTSGGLARADQAEQMVLSRQCFPAALLLAQDVEGSEDPAALQRFCSLATSSCDGSEKPFRVPSDLMDSGNAWQGCLRRTTDIVRRLATLPPGETCEERAALATTSDRIASMAQAAYGQIGANSARIEAARTKLLSLPPILLDDPCPPMVDRGSVLADARSLLLQGGPSGERLVVAMLAADMEDDAGALNAVQDRAAEEGNTVVAAAAAVARADRLSMSGQLEAGLAAADEAVLLTAEADLAAAEERALAIRARLLDSLQGDRRAVIAAYAAALRALDRRRPELLTYDWINQGSPYRLRVEPLIDRYIGLQIDEAATQPADERLRIYREVLRFADRARAAELSDYFRDDCVADLQARTRTVGEIDPKAAALVTIVRGTEIELFMLLPDGEIQHRRVPLPVVAELEAYPWQLIDRTQPDGWKEQSRELYDLLIRPFAVDLERSDISTLVFVPDGPLRHVLPATLLDGDRLLIERYAVALNPGLDFIDDAPAQTIGSQWLLAAVSKACPPRWDALDGTAQEVNAISALRPSASTVVMVNDNFDRTDLFRDVATRTLSVLHFATHAEFAPEASDSKVLLGSCDELNLDDLERLIKQARYRDRPVEMLVLSACQSALGDDRAALGLAGLAVKSGARSAIGSMWKVDDEAAVRLMTLFHGELARGDVGKAEALRQAQLALAAEPGMAAPMNWAAFQIVGDWR